jgi:putative DNA-invertase from lambdoid prophage Rac
VGVIAAVYLRVSTDRQDEANQEPECLRLCAARGWEPQVFRETESGTKRRPEWERLKTYVRRGEARAVVFWALDRAGRNRVQLAHDLGELWRWGAEIASVRDAWVDQPAGPLRDLLVQLMAWFAQTERDRIVERTRAGIARARAMGVRLGRPPAMPDAARERARRLAAAQSLAYTPGEVRKILRAEGFGDFDRRTVKRAMEG